MIFICFLNFTNLYYDCLKEIFRDMNNVLLFSLFYLIDSHAVIETINNFIECDYFYFTSKITNNGVKYFTRCTKISNWRLVNCFTWCSKTIIQLKKHDGEKCFTSLYFH